MVHRPGIIYFLGETTEPTSSRRSSYLRWQRRYSWFSTSYNFPGATISTKYLLLQTTMSGQITDKVNIENGAEFTFVCSKIPFAMSCSTDLQHKDFNVIDLDLVNKMKIPLKQIRVSHRWIFYKKVDLLPGTATSTFISSRRNFWHFLTQTSIFWDNLW